MASSKIITLSCWLGIMALLAITLSAVAIGVKLNAIIGEERLAKMEKPSKHLGPVSRFLADRRRSAQMACDRYPTVCAAKGRVGPDCCNRQCVNVMTNKENHGKCGKRCSYTDKCCQGKCVNPYADNNHCICGRCNNACMSHSSPYFPYYV